MVIKHFHETNLFVSPCTEGGEGDLEFSELGFDDFRVRDVEVIACRAVGDIPGSVEDGTKDF